MKFLFPLIVGAGAFALSFTPPAVHAATIIGEMSFTQGGAHVFDATLSPTTIPSATPLGALQIVAGSARVSVYGTDGDFGSAIGETVVFTPVTYQFSDTGLLWTAGVFQFFAQSAVINEVGNAFHLHTTGFLRSPNFEDTPAIWVFTTQGNLSTVTWTSNVTVVPEPSMWMAGAALQTCWFVFRRKRTA